jgi:hypothetical protein
MHIRRPSAPGVIALLALFFALGGTAIAAKHYLITSTSQIKPSVLRQLHGQTGAVGPQGASGVTGPQGPTGPQGTQGPAGASNATYVTAGPYLVGAGAQTGGTATCPSGQVVSGGGAYGNSASPNQSIDASFPRIGPGSSVPNQWGAYFDNNTGSDTTFAVYAICVAASATVESSFAEH